MGRVEERELFVPTQIMWMHLRLLLKPCPDALAHLGGGRFGEGHHQDLLERYRRLLLDETIQAALDQRARLACAGSSHDKNVAARRDGLLLSSS